LQLPAGGGVRDDLFASFFLREGIYNDDLHQGHTAPTNMQQQSQYN